MPSNTPSPYRRPWSHTETTALPRSCHVPSIHTVEGIGGNLPPMPSPDNRGSAPSKLVVYPVIVVPVVIVIPECVEGRLDPVADHALIRLALVGGRRVHQRRAAHVEEPVRDIHPHRHISGLDIAHRQRDGKLHFLARIEVRGKGKVAASAALTVGPRDPDGDAGEIRIGGN